MDQAHPHASSLPTAPGAKLEVPPQMASLHEPQPSEAVCRQQSEQHKLAELHKRRKHLHWSDAYAIGCPACKPSLIPLHIPTNMDTKHPAEQVS